MVKRLHNSPSAVAYAFVRPVTRLCAQPNVMLALRLMVLVILPPCPLPARRPDGSNAVSCRVAEDCQIDHIARRQRGREQDVCRACPVVAMAACGVHTAPVTTVS